MTHASGTGWGAHLDSRMVQGTWLREDTKKSSSNWRELRAIALALSLSERSPRTARADLLGQLLNGGLYQQARGYQEQAPLGPGGNHCSSLLGSIFEGGTELGSRLTQQENAEGE